MQLALNEPVPDFTLPDLEGRIHMLSDYRGRIAIVNFWSAECPHSERFDADITARLAGWGAEVALLSIASNANEPDGKLAAEARQREVPVVLRDAGQRVAGRYVKYFPHLRQKVSALVLSMVMMISSRSPASFARFAYLECPAGASLLL